MQVVVYAQHDGLVAIIYPNENHDIQDAVVAVPEGAEYLIIDSESLPQDRAYRNAWVISGEDVVVDPIKAAEASAKEEADAAAAVGTIAHAKSLGFTDEMIRVMYPNLGA